MRLWIRSLALLSGLRIWRCCQLWCRWQMQLGSGVNCGCGVGQWLAIALIRPLAWELHMPWVQPYKRQKEKKKRKKKKIRDKVFPFCQHYGLVVSTAFSSKQGKSTCCSLFNIKITFRNGIKSP